jgi:hypothetical protein
MHAHDLIAAVLAFLLVLPAQAEPFQVTENEQEIRIVSEQLEATIRKKGYVSGVAGGTLVDKKTGFRDAGFGLDIVDWIMEPGSDEEYRDKLPDHMVYHFGNDYHGKTPKRSLAGPQICTKAAELSPRVTRGDDFVAVEMDYTYPIAAPGHQAGSKWTQTLVFPEGKRYFISSDRIDSTNASDAMFLRIDMPGHVKHNRGDTFSHIYLSYLNQTNTPRRFAEGLIPAAEFLENFAPDERFNYRRERAETPPERFIRAYRLRESATGREGPWLAGMTLDPSVVYEAWCHQRGYVCMIEEFGGRPIEPGESFRAAFVVGYFDSIEEMNRVYDEFRGSTNLTVTQQAWRLQR